MTELPTLRPALHLVNRVPDRKALDALALHRGAPQGVAAPIRVLVAESQALVRAAYRTLLETEARITVVAEAARADAALTMTDEMRPDVVLLDLALPGLDTLEATALTISQPAFAEAAVMLLTESDDDERLVSALRAGASGVLSKDADAADLIWGVYTLARGSALISPERIHRLLRGVPLRWVDRSREVELLAELTERERVVVALVAQGLTNPEIADHLVISPATAKTHVSRAMVKLGAGHRAQLVNIAYESGLVRPRSADRLGAA